MVELDMKRTTLLLIAAITAGFIGGHANSQDRSPAIAPSVLRASRIELVDERGSIVAAWEAASGGSRIRFLSRRGITTMDIGSDVDGRPRLRMYGGDGRQRVLLALNAEDKPSFGMSDERWEGRVSLGFLQPDFLDRNWTNGA